MTMVIDGSNGLKFPDNTNQQTAIGYNRIINGAMMIDQRNAGASVTVTTGTVYGADRFNSSKSTASGTMTVQQSNTVPVGFKKSLLHTVSTGASPAVSDQNRVEHCIEGNNLADFDFGTANAKSFTFSFWVRSSITGTYAVAFLNAGWNRSYVATYTVDAANTWEQKTITVAGDTTGTWATDNTVGIRLKFDLGSGSNYNTASPNTWVSGEYYRTSSTVTLLGTTGATFYITGVQLEKGSTATSFDYRPYGTELQLCQRYFEMSYAQGTAIGTSGFICQGGVFYSQDTSNAIGNCPFSVAKRASPTVAIYSPSTGASGKARDNASTSDVTMTVNDIQNTGFNRLTGTLTAGRLFSVQWTASSEL